jgi:hypothetical protein
VRTLERELLERELLNETGRGISYSPDARPAQIANTRLLTQVATMHSSFEKFWEAAYQMVDSFFGRLPCVRGNGGPRYGPVF